MSDLISRQKALDGLKYEMKYGAEIDRCGLDTAYDIIENIPSAEPERKKEKWLHKPNEYDDDTYECSRCGEPWTLIEGTPKENNMNYCPNCGADMRGE